MSAQEKAVPLRRDLISYRENRLRLSIEQAFCTPFIVPNGKLELQAGDILLTIAQQKGQGVIYNED
ncbi:MAG: hypothetical protein IKO85_02265 [Bacteroidaceae bacterium]|nr:hypothetical protein [Bacteroidaceae bacterium]